MDELVQLRDEINSRESFVNFVNALHQAIVEGKTNDNWINLRLESYLEALAAWTEDMDGVFENLGEPIPEQSDWKLFGRIMFAAFFYE